ncbi:early nodulin-like protein 2, partial [Tanacetum coccineum]
KPNTRFPNILLATVSSRSGSLVGQGSTCNRVCRSEYPSAVRVCQRRTFEVGGKNGWTTSPSENYNSWAGRLRFLINDTLHFKYDGGKDSVLVVNKGDYDGCNVNNPITKLEGGDSTFKLDRSGPFYFISGNKPNCDQGEKMTVVVLALRNRSPPPGAATPPSSVATPPSSIATPPSPSTISPVSPSPVSDSPESPVSPSPFSGSPESSVSPVLSPYGSPTSTPSGDAPALTPSGSSPGPGGAAAGGPGGAPGQSPGSNPADTNSPPPSSAAARPLSGTIMASFVTMVFGLWLLN